MRRRTRIPRLYACCICVSAVYVATVILLAVRATLSKHLVSTDNRPSLACVNNAEFLCLQTTQPRTLLVEVPFTKHDIQSLELTVALWRQTWPCYRAPLTPSRPDLVFGFNGNLSDPDHRALRERLAVLTSQPVILECFGQVSVESACLSGIGDTYDKRRLDANWTAGPNNLFFHFMDVAINRGYRYMAQLEPDTFPLRPLWLEQMVCLATHSTAWVIGSPFMSQCAHDAQTGRCEELGERIKFHINGNALYAVGDANFREYCAGAFAGDLFLWPFDLALHLYMDTLSDTTRRRLASKFRAHPFILNYGAEPLTPEAAIASVAESSHGVLPTELSSAPSLSSLSSSSPFSAADGVLPLLRRLATDTYLVHSSWAMAQLRNHGLAGFAMLGINAPQDGLASLHNGISLGETHGEALLAHALSTAANPTLHDPSQAPGTNKGAAQATQVTHATSHADVADLIDHARRAADSDRRLILTFATAVYDPLCRNFMAHAQRLNLRNYLLVTFTRAYHRDLADRGVSAYLHELPLLTSGGSDTFASKDFFTINAARYTVLTRLLRNGFHVFSVDLDVVLLQDPFPYVWSQPYDLLLQSDARDAITLVETSPFLLRDRLRLPKASNVTYVNGGVFFARGTHGVARLFEDTWALTSQDLGVLNEQDCLNRMLLASYIRWAPLPPELFPNGYVFFRRPVLHGTISQTHLAFSDQLAASHGPVLLHCNWINGIPAKRFLFREILVWANAPADLAMGSSADVSADGSDGVAQRYLAYTIGETAAERSLGAQMHALRTALALAHITNRTLLLPAFYILPVSDLTTLQGQQHMHSTAPPADQRVGSEETTLAATVAREQRGALLEGRRTFTYFFEYAPLAHHFPRHRESSFLRARWGDALPTPVEVPQALISSSESGNGNGANKNLESWLEKWQSEPLLRIASLRHVSSLNVIPDAGQHEFEQRLDAALQPAPELRVIAHHIITKLHSHVSKLHGARKPLGGISGLSEYGHRSARHSSSARKRGGSTHDFTCLYLTRLELGSIDRLRAAASHLPSQAPTVVMYEVGGELQEPANGTVEGEVGPASTTGRSAQEQANREAEQRRENRVADHRPSHPRLPPAVSKIFDAPLVMGDFFPYWDAVEVSDAEAGHSLAYDMVQQLVCSAARRVHGDASSDFIHATCLWRRSRIFSNMTSSSSTQKAGKGDVCDQLRYS